LVGYSDEPPTNFRTRLCSPGKARRTESGAEKEFLARLVANSCRSAGASPTEAVLNLNDTQDNTNTRFADKVHSSSKQPRGANQRCLSLFEKVDAKPPAASPAKRSIVC
jgi:hypothetical protein